MSYVDLESKPNVRILCELGDGAHCGAAVFCKAERTIIPGKLDHPRGGKMDNPSVANLCTSQYEKCPSRRAFIETHRTQQQEAARERRVHELGVDRDAEILEEFTKPAKAKG